MVLSRCRSVIRTVVRLVGDLLQMAAAAAVRSHTQLAAENLFLSKQLALYVERQVKPRRADDATRTALVALSRLIDWRGVLSDVALRTAASLERVSGSDVGFHCVPSARAEQVARRPVVTPARGCP